jgi:N6-adenosine-specific RNA methylase IME4
MTVFDELDPPYSTIVADPPWAINKVQKRTRPNQVDMDYSMMTLDEIKALPVADLAADVATCFVWTIDRYLYDTPAVLAAWGFKYHLTMAWDKTNGMAMFGFNRQTEFVVVGFKGTHDAYPEGPVMRSSFTASVGKAHSVKPDCFLDAVEARFPGPYVELFCRRPRFGWDSWGKGYEIPETRSA